jgi:hypothetical protein
MSRISKPTNQPHLERADDAGLLLREGLHLCGWSELLEGLLGLYLSELLERLLGLYLSEFLERLLELYWSGLVAELRGSHVLPRYEVSSK